VTSIARRCRGKSVAFFLQNLEGGGAERAIIGLAGEISEMGCSVDLVVAHAEGDYCNEISSEVNVVNLASESHLLVLWRLIVFLRQRKPDVVMSALDVPNIMLVIAAKIAGYRGRAIVSQRAVVAASQREWSLSHRWLIMLLQRTLFKRADALISNSHAAAKELRALFGVPAERIYVIHNAVNVRRIIRLSDESLSAIWLSKMQGPLIVSVGSLTTRKDVGTLIRAFALVKAKRQASLVLVGKVEGENSGGERGKIEKLISDLELGANVHLPGFDANPYKWIAAAAVFVSSSTAEGFSNVIAEALALGRAIVATDCPGDTAELLQHGKWGRLVPVGDPERMADAILAALDDPNPPDGRIRAWDFVPSKSTSAYLKVLLPECEQATENIGQSL
jgi:glycosyltransferase involved in cell wall biosynthesis